MFSITTPSLKESLRPLTARSSKAGALGSGGILEAGGMSRETRTDDSGDAIRRLEK